MDRQDLSSFGLPDGSRYFLGAHRWRCEYCRLNFASFRQRKEPFTFSRWKNRNPEVVAEKPAEPAARDAVKAEKSPIESGD